MPGDVVLGRDGGVLFIRRSWPNGWCENPRAPG